MPGIYPIENEDYRERDGTIKRGEQTDHNTITMIWDTTVQIQTGKTTIWKKGTEEKWQLYNKHIQEQNTHTQITTYDELEIAIKQALTKTTGKKGNKYLNKEK